MSRWVFLISLATGIGCSSRPDQTAAPTELGDVGPLDAPAEDAAPWNTYPEGPYSSCAVTTPVMWSSGSWSA